LDSFFTTVVRTADFVLDFDLDLCFYFYIELNPKSDFKLEIKSDSEGGFEGGFEGSSEGNFESGSEGDSEVDIIVNSKLLTFQLQNP
jgi:hypothetical protein